MINTVLCRMKKSCSKSGKSSEISELLINVTTGQHYMYERKDHKVKNQEISNVLVSLLVLNIIFLEGIVRFVFSKCLKS
jgi:hypothetical protein